MSRRTTFFLASAGLCCGTVALLVHEMSCAKRLVRAAAVGVIAQAAKGDGMLGLEPGSYRIGDVDGYGRNWGVWITEVSGRKRLLTFQAARGIGPIPLFNTAESIQLIRVESTEQQL
jgi:hypothetical protein